MIEPSDIPFVVASPTPELAPTTARKRTARHREPDPERVRRGKRNRRAGNAAQLEWAKRIGGRNVGILGDWDVLGPDGTAWEVKAFNHAPRLSEVVAALEQVERSAALAGRDYGLAWRLPNAPANKRWLVIRWG